MKNIGKALLVFQSKNRAQKTNAENPFFKSDYVTLERVWDDIRADLQSVGLSIIQNPMYENNLYGIESIIIHVESGETISTKLLMPLAKQDPQGVGSAITYARRYCLTSQLGLTVDTDDDGNAGSHEPKTTQAPKQETKQETKQEPKKDTAKQPEKPQTPLSMELNIKQIRSMLEDMFPNPVEQSAYLEKVTTWTDKDKNVHKGFTSTAGIKSDKQSYAIMMTVKKDWQNHMNAVNAGQDVKTSKDGDGVPF